MDNPQKPHPKHPLAMGVALWIVFCIVAVAVRGVRWDETFEHAQALARHVAYPQGHPLLRFVRNVFSLQTYVSGALLWLTHSPTAVCGFRNVLFLAASTVPVFLLTALVARRAVWGHAAALLALQHVLIEFDGSYPLIEWPDVFSNGPIGGGYALLTLYCFAAGRRRTAFFLLGLMPCIHVGQWPPVLLLGVCFGCWEYFRGDRAGLRHGLSFGIAGLALCAVFWLSIRAVTVPPPTSGPYLAAAPSHSIWAGYTAFYDPHRQPPPGTGVAGLLGAVLLSGAAAWCAFRRTERGGPLFWYFVYILGIGAAVGGVMALHRLAGTEAPFWLVGWMPYRLINHVPVVLLAVIVGVLTQPSGDSGRPSPYSLLLVGAMTYGVLQPGIERLVGAHVYERYFVVGTCVLFGLYGAASAVTLLRLSQKDRRVFAAAAALAIAALAGLAGYHQFGTFCVLLGAGLATGLRWVDRRIPRPVYTRGEGLGVAALCGLTVLFLLAGEAKGRAHLPRNGFEKRVEAYLVSQGKPGAMLAGAPDTFLLQAKTGHPVLADAVTPSLMSYMPSLAPSIQSIFDDLYGIRFDKPPQGQNRRWQSVWTRRSRVEWVRLSGKYGFEYVVALDALTLDLDAVVRDGPFVLYHVSAQNP